MNGRDRADMYKMMIVDDEPNVVEGIRDCIKWGRYGVVVCATAYDGADALEKSHLTKPDIVIADIRMPEMNGLDMINEMRRNLPESVFIVISAFEHFEYAKRAINMGVTAYLTKPVRAREIVEKVAEAVEKLDGYKSADGVDVGGDIADCYDVIDQAKNFIEMNRRRQTDVSLEEVAAHVSLSSAYFSRLFKKETGMLFVEYVKRKKLDAAKAMLLQTNMKVYAISKRLGYKSVQYFATMFKEREGMTPGEFRAKKRGDKKYKTDTKRI
ncbi:MAG: response regulator transcription factor [Christensenellales bacterium]|jgi:two-component system response regulator YesN